MAERSPDLPALPDLAPSDLPDPPVLPAFSNRPSRARAASAPPSPFPEFPRPALRSSEAATRSTRHCSAPWNDRIDDPGFDQIFVHLGLRIEAPVRLVGLFHLRRDD